MPEWYLLFALLTTLAALGFAWTPLLAATPLALAALAAPLTQAILGAMRAEFPPRPDRKSTRLNSSHANISYAVFCLKKKSIFASCALLPSPLDLLPIRAPIPLVRSGLNSRPADKAQLFCA